MLLKMEIPATTVRALYSCCFHVWPSLSSTPCKVLADSYNGYYFFPKVNSFMPKTRQKHIQSSFSFPKVFLVIILPFLFLFFHQPLENFEKTPHTAQLWNDLTPFPWGENGETRSRLSLYISMNQTKQCLLVQLLCTLHKTVHSAGHIESSFQWHLTILKSSLDFEKEGIEK